MPRVRPCARRSIPPLLRDKSREFHVARGESLNSRLACSDPTKARLTQQTLSLRFSWASFGTTNFLTGLLKAQATALPPSTLVVLVYEPAICRICWRRGIPPFCD